MTGKNDYEQYEVIDPEQYFWISICPTCRTLIYKYPTKEGGYKWVTVLEDMTIHRWGNHNNFVSGHECGGDKRSSPSRKNMVIEIIPVSDEIKSMTPHPVQQQALVIALEDYSKPRIRSKFKKGMFAQASAYVHGEGKYANPYSPKQAMMILLGKKRDSDRKREG
jgi:hypothetical protein